MQENVDEVAIENVNNPTNQNIAEKILYRTNTGSANTAEACSHGTEVVNCKVDSSGTNQNYKEHCLSIKDGLQHTINQTNSLVERGFVSSCFSSFSRTAP